MGIGNLSFPAYWFSGGEGAEANSTCLRSSVLSASWRSTFNLKSSRVSLVQANALNLLLISPISYLRRSSFFGTCVILLSLISTAYLSSCKNLLTVAGAGAGSFVAPDFGPDLFDGNLLVAIEYREFNNSLDGYWLAPQPTRAYCKLTSLKLTPFR